MLNRVMGLFIILALIAVPVSARGGFDKKPLEAATKTWYSFVKSQNAMGGSQTSDATRFVLNLANIPSEGIGGSTGMYQGINEPAVVLVRNGQYVGTSDSPTLSIAPQEYIPMPLPRSTQVLLVNKVDIKDNGIKIRVLTASPLATQVNGRAMYSQIFLQFDLGKDFMAAAAENPELLKTELEKYLTPVQ